MTQYGICMNVTGVNPNINICEHRMLFYINPNQSDDKIRHQLAYTKYADFAFTKPLSLDEFLNICIKYNIVPIVNLCISETSEQTSIGWGKHPIITIKDCAKIGKILAQYMYDKGFRKDKAYIALFNEPNTDGKLNTRQVCEYTNELNNNICNYFDVIYGNDEFGNLDWNYLGTNCTAKIMGIHHLSSLGTWTEPKKYWKNIEDCKTIANMYKKDIIGIECGSWFRDYLSSDGHKINIDILKECKRLEYKACLLVLPDTNQQCRSQWKLLGYRIWNNDYTKIISGSQSKFDEFIDYIKKEGEQISIMEYLRPEELQALYDEFGLKTPYWWETPNLFVAGKKDPNKQVTWADIDAMEETRMKALVSGLKKVGALPTDFPDYMNIKYKSDGTWNANWQSVAKSGGLK